MARIANWQLAFAELISRWQTRPFSWVTADCCQFGAEDVAALTGRDPREIFPAYSSEAEALAILVECDGFEGLVTRALGPPMENKAFAQPGDIVLCDFGQGSQPAVCAGVWCVAPGAHGLEKRTMASAIAAWRVE